MINMVDASLSEWAQFETHIYRIILRDFPRKDGWTIEMYSARTHPRFITRVSWDHTKASKKSK
jgi:23S rRNA G2069 N7-methylase RlmK/C1962 C5-methylase RlmI